MHAQRQFRSLILLMFLASLFSVANGAVLTIEETSFDTGHHEQCRPDIFLLGCPNEPDGNRDLRSLAGPLLPAFQQLVSSEASIDAPLLGHAQHLDSVRHDFRLSLDGSYGESSAVWIQAAASGDLEAKSALALGGATADILVIIQVAQGLTSWAQMPALGNIDDPRLLFGLRWEASADVNFGSDDKRVEESLNEVLDALMVADDPSTDLWVSVYSGSGADAFLFAGVPYIGALGVSAKSDFYDVDEGIRYSFSLTREEFFPGEKPTPVPEPALLSLLAIGVPFVALAGTRRRVDALPVQAHRQQGARPLSA